MSPFYVEYDNYDNEWRAYEDSVTDRVFNLVYVDEFSPGGYGKVKVGSVYIETDDIKEAFCKGVDLIRERMTDDIHN
jgi:hypothetical protein